jgi:uncharacterized membrane protein
MWKNVRANIITGLIVLAPTLITLYLLVLVFVQVDGILGGVVERLVGVPIPGLGFLLASLLVLSAGALATNLIGQRIIGAAEKFIERIPIVGSIYVATRQIRDVILLKNKAIFEKVVLVEYPRLGIYSVGFVTKDGLKEVEEKIGQKVLSVFIPTTPNPTSGFLLLIPEEEVVFLNISTEDALKLIISGGLVTPANGDLTA